MSQRSVTSLVCVILTCSAVQAGDWTQWRGPNHNNVAEAGQSVATNGAIQKTSSGKWMFPGAAMRHRSSRATPLCCAALMTKARHRR